MEDFKKMCVSEGYFRNKVKECQASGHVQQVAFSTYENAFTQVCFCCKKVRTTFNKGFCCGEICELEYDE